jgi:hypothetical protein
MVITEPLDIDNEFDATGDPHELLTVTIYVPAVKLVGASDGEAAYEAPLRVQV